MPPQPSNMQPHPHPGHPGQPPPQGNWCGWIINRGLLQSFICAGGHGPRGYAPSSNRSSPAARMAHPGQQQIDFGVSEHFSGGRLNLTVSPFYSLLPEQ